VSIFVGVDVKAAVFAEVDVVVAVSGGVDVPINAVTTEDWIGLIASSMMNIEGMAMIPTKPNGRYFLKRYTPLPPSTRGGVFAKAMYIQKPKRATKIVDIDIVIPKKKFLWISSTKPTIKVINPIAAVIRAGRLLKTSNHFCRSFINLPRKREYGAR